MSSEFGSWLIHHFAVSLLKSSKRDLDFGCGSGPKASVFLIKLTVSCAATKSIAPRLSSGSLRAMVQASALLLQMYMWRPQNAGSALPSLLGLDINSVCTPGKTKVGLLLRNTPSARLTTVLRIHCSLQIWRRLWLLPSVLISCCFASDDLPISTIVFLYFPFASGDWGL